MNKFSEDYINFVAGLGREILPERYWWYTSLSSKNRFQSKLLSYFETLQSGKQTVEIPQRRDLKFLVHFLGAEFIKTLYSWFSGFRIRKNLSKSQSPYVLFSFAYESSYRGEQYRDSYWGNLPDHLKKQSDVVIFVRPLGCLKKSIQWMKKSPVIPVYTFISPLSFLRVLFRFLRLYSSWENKSSKHWSVVGPLLRDEIYNDSLFYALLVEEACESVFTTVSPRKILIPFEGNAWERAVVTKAREHKSIKVSGYVHTVVPEISTNLFPGKGEYSSGPFPDEILVLGDVPKTLLKDRGHYPANILKSSCALRFESLLKLSREPERGQKIVLVILEGVLPAARIVDYVLEQASFLSEWTFQLRFHPALPWEKMKGMSRYGNVPFPPNVKISEVPSLYEAIKESRVCLYWGSTAGIEALYLGRPIIHLDLGSVLSYDPLFSHQGFHWRVSVNENLAPKLTQIDSLSTAEKNKLYSESIQFLKSYFGEISPESLQIFY